MSNDHTQEPFEGEPQSPLPEESSELQDQGQQLPQEAVFPEAPVVEAADFLGLDAELSARAQAATQGIEPMTPQAGEPGPVPGPASASSWLFQESDFPAPAESAETPAEDGGLTLEPPPIVAETGAASAPRPGASWLLDPERSAAASHLSQDEEGNWLMEQEEFAAPPPDVDPNVELPEGSYFEPEPRGRAVARMMARGMAAALAGVGLIGAFKAYTNSTDVQQVSQPITRPEVAMQLNGRPTRLEPLQAPAAGAGAGTVAGETTGRTARQPETTGGERQPAVRRGSRETRTPSLLGTIRREWPGPVAGSLAERRFVFVPTEVSEARGVLDNLEALARGERPVVARREPAAGKRVPSTPAERIEAARRDPRMQPTALAPIWCETLAVAQKSLEVGLPAQGTSMDPYALRIAQAEVVPGTQWYGSAPGPQPEAMTTVEPPLLAEASDAPALQQFGESLLEGLARASELPLRESGIALDPVDVGSLSFPPSLTLPGQRLVSAEIVGATGAPFAPQVIQEEAGPGMGPLVGVSGPMLAQADTPFSDTQASFGPQPLVTVVSPPATEAMAEPALEPATDPATGSESSALASGLGSMGPWPGLASPGLDMPELSPSTLRYAESSDMWMRTSIPLDRIEEEERVRTPRVGLVRAVSVDGEVFLGKLHAVGEGRLWLDTNLGRMSIDRHLLEDVARIEGQGTGELNGQPRTAGLDRVRVRAAGGYFVGYQLSRQGDRVVLLTDEGNKLTLDSDQIEPDGPRKVSILRRPEGDDTGE